MIFDDHKTLLNPNNVELHNDLYNEFDSYCFTVTIFKKKELHVEFRYAFSKIFVFVEQIFRIEHSRTLICFFEIFIHFIQIEFSDVIFIFHDFIKKMSEKIIKKKYF